MEIVYFVVSFLSSVIGAICGIGGGVIIKPVLDVTSTLPLTNISLLSGATVFSMAVSSVIRNMRNKKGVQIDLVQSTYLALGAGIGGFIGRTLFDSAYLLFENKNLVGAIQAALLTSVTVGALIYQLNKSKIKTLVVHKVWLFVIIGLSLGTLSAFIGIGGGPINLIVLAYFFSYDAKKAAANSLYIIMFSQFISLSKLILTTTMVYPPTSLIILMIIGGISGSIVGGKINKKISAKKVDQLFIGAIIVIVLLNFYNLINFIL